ncbi:hypothetical protein ABIE89_002905 [Bradyrhizobium niftali]
MDRWRLDLVIPGRAKREPGIQRLWGEILRCAIAPHSSRAMRVPLNDWNNQSRLIAMTSLPACLIRAIAGSIGSITVAI